MSSNGLLTNLKTFLTFNRNLNTVKKTYYDVLNLPRNCSEKEIKQAFITLSKKYHPDKNKSSDSHKDFVHVAEAYRVLSKRSSRTEYDLRLSSERGFGTRNSDYGRSREDYSPRSSKQTEYYEKAHADTSFYTNRDRRHDRRSEQKPYYGVSFIKNRMANSTIVLVCFIVATVGLILQLIVIRKTYSRKQEHLKKNSDSNQYLLNAVRDSAKLNGNEAQAARLLKKISDSATESVSTAAMVKTIIKTSDSR